LTDSLALDWETRSVLDLKEVGLWNYSRHSTTDIWCGAYAFNDEPVELWVPGQPCPPRVYEHIAAGGAVTAWNFPFEIALNNQVAVKYGWPEMRIEQGYCSMALGYAMGLPGRLEDAAMALGLHVRKDTEGYALMLRMCRPRSKPGKPLVWWDEPEKKARLYEYCKTDVEVERATRKRLMPLSAKERKVWLLDYKINQRGVQIDIPSAKAAVKLADTMKERYDDEMAKATDGAATTCTALGPIKEWLANNGCERALVGLAKQDVVDLLDDPAVGPDARRVLTLRQEAGKASNAKFNVMLNQAGEDGRLRNMYQYHGAGTGRWAGRAVQTHNLPRNMPKAEAVERILEHVRKGEHDAIDAIYGPPLSVVSSCLRSFFVAPKGKRIISGDFANVEGRGQAWFAGESWKLDAFRAADNKTGPGIYELAYARMFGVPVESVKNPSEERQVGKVSELAFGYQGGVGSFHVMAKTYGVKVPDAEADKFKEAWRNAHPRIKGVWYDIQNAAIAAVKNPDTIRECGYPGRQAKFRMVGSFLWCLLPSGRAICYPYPKILEGQFGPQLTYMTVPSQEDRRKGKIIHDPKNTSNWARIGTYGGSLFNNIIQGTCRDLLAEVMLALDAKGYPIVLHTHDDCNLEVALADSGATKIDMERHMRTPPAWAAGFPLHADCGIMERYGK